MKLLLTILLSIIFQNILAWEEVSSDEYLALSAAEKSEIILANCLEDATSAPWFSLLEMPGIFVESMCPTLRAKGDELPWEQGLIFSDWRKKYIHTVGTVGQVEFRSSGDHPYTGIFEGAEHGYARFSLAKEPSESSLNTAPGMGLKFLRDGMDSANLVAMYSVNGQESWNFFANDFTNHVGPGGLDLVPLEIKFSEATNYVAEVALSDFARYGQSGVSVKNPKFPFMLRFHPTGELMFSDEYVRPFTEDLTSIPKGSVLYEVYALDEPEELGGSEQFIGELVLVSDMVTTKWGDQHLFFRHQDMAEDVAIRPEWEPYLAKFGIEGPSGCPMHNSVLKGRRADQS